MNSKLQNYLASCNVVYHTTLDPKGFGCIRIHLVPPKKVKMGIPWVCILNGYSVLPLQTSWAILLKEFIIELNKTDGKELEPEEIKTLVNKVCDNVHELFPKARRTDIKNDLQDIIRTFKAVINGIEPDVKIGFMTLAKYAKYMSAPHRMDLMVSSMTKDGKWNCNQNCLHCYAKGEKLSEVEELTTAEWFSIIDKLQEAMVPSLTFTGGEPTLREDLVLLVKHAYWFVTRLNTNGIMLSKKLCQELYDASLDSVQVTFYSYDKEIHNELVGTASYDLTLLGLKNAIEAGLDVSCNTPLCSINSDYVKTIEFLSSLGVHYFSCSGLIPTGGATTDDSKITKLSKEEITTIIKDAYKYCKKNGLELSFTSPGWIDEDILSQLNLVVPSCGASLSNMAVSPNGEVIPCQSWLFEDGLGNILTSDWKKIWNSKKCKTIRKKSIQNNNKCLLSEVKE